LFFVKCSTDDIPQHAALVTPCFDVFISVHLYFNQYILILKYISATVTDLHLHGHKHWCIIFIKKSW